jgi:hypothetical protein
VTGVQTCALPIYGDQSEELVFEVGDMVSDISDSESPSAKIVFLPATPMLVPYSLETQQNSIPTPQ